MSEKTDHSVAVTSKAAKDGYSSAGLYMSPVMGYPDLSCLQILHDKTFLRAGQDLRPLVLQHCRTPAANKPAHAVRHSLP